MRTAWRHLRKIRQEILTNDDISNAFDDITYEKGAAVIRMFEVWAGEKQFQRGVSTYLKHYEYKNARMGDFLDAIAQTGQPRLSAAFQTFLNQPGVPENCGDAEVRRSAIGGADPETVSSDRVEGIGETDLAGSGVRAIQERQGR